MAKKKPFVLRIDPGLLSSVEKWAADEFRSTNGQLEWIVREALKKAGRVKKTGSGEEMIIGLPTDSDRIIKIRNPKICDSDRKVFPILNLFVVFFLFPLHYF